MKVLTEPQKWFAAAALLMLGSCATAEAPAVSAEAFSQDTARLEEYELGPADKVRLIVYGEPDLSGEFAINAQGQISLPLLGEIDATGLTIDELRASITEGLSQGYVNDARVAAEVVSFRPYYILGEVATPGEYPYAAGMTVMKAIAAAQGFTYRARKSSVFIQRANATEETKVELTQELMVYPGDVIRVGERFF